MENLHNCDFGSSKILSYGGFNAALIENFLLQGKTFDIEINPITKSGEFGITTVYGCVCMIDRQIPKLIGRPSKYSLGKKLNDLGKKNILSGTFALDDKKLFFHIKNIDINVMFPEMNLIYDELKSKFLYSGKLDEIVFISPKGQDQVILKK